MCSRIKKERERIAQFIQLSSSSPNVSLRYLAKKCNSSPATLSNFLNGVFPNRKWEDIEKGLRDVFRDESIHKALDNINTILNEKKPQEQDMILRKQTLDEETRMHFNMIANPFADPKNINELYLSKRSRFVRECLLDAAVNGNFLALVGESGAGKSTLRMDLIENLKNNDKQVIMIEPYTLNMSANGKSGTLKSRHIMEAILSTLRPNESVPSSPEMMARKVHKCLQESSRGGFKHCLIIEEAHDLHTATLKHLKRFWELVDGMQRLLSIILIGQPELSRILGTTQAEIREVVQRCDVVELPAVDDVSNFLSFKFKKAGYKLENFFDEKALFAMQERLYVAKSKETKGIFYGYPLAITNLATAAMNIAASLGEEKVSAEIVAQIQR